MSIPVLRIVAKAESDLVICRHRTRQLAELAGISELATTQLITAASEIIRNAIKYAGEARVEFNITEQNNKQFLQIAVTDNGPGLDPNKISASGKVSGLAVSQRLVDDLRFSSSDSGGTRIELYKMLPSAKKRVNQAETVAWVNQLKNNSPFSVVDDLEQQNKQLIDTLQELERYRKKLEEKTEQLNQANKYKAEFLANMSHEIRTPMNAIIGISNILERTQMSGEQRKYLMLIKDAGTALLDIINDILDFSKIEAGKLSIESVEFEFADHVETCVELLSANAHSKGLSLHCWIDSEVPSVVYGDSVRLRQILVNLINNAIKFTSEGQVLLRVKLLEDINEDALIRFEVSDTGIGLSEEQRSKLFQPFVQADGSTARKYGGTGLGLSISKQLVDLMKGRIGVESVLGAGSTFWFELPYTKKILHSTPQPELPFKKALVVDDHHTMREIASTLLSTWSIETLTVSSAAEALKLLGIHSDIDLFILDFVLPGMNGLDLTAKLRELPAHQNTPIILLTSLHDEGLGEKAIAAGCDAFLTKPLRQRFLLQCLSSFVPNSLGHLKSTLHTTQFNLSANLNSSGKMSAGKVASTVVHTSQGVPDKAYKEEVRQGLQVLLVEDNPTNQIVAEIELRNLNCDVVIASNGEEALQILKRQKFAMAFMDCQMPGMDGYEATKHIRAAETKTGKHLPIIAMTANAMAGDRARCIDAGMDDYISKPFEPENLRKMVEKWAPAQGAEVCEAVHPSGNEAEDKANVVGSGKETPPVARAKESGLPSTSARDAVAKLLAGGNPKASTDKSEPDTVRSVNVSAPGASADPTDNAIAPATEGNMIAIDFEKLKGRFTVEQSKQLLTVFLADTEKKLPELRALLQSNDAVGLGKIGHSIKGAASMIFAEGLAQAARELEMAGKANEGEKFPVLIENIFIAFEQLKAAASAAQ